MMKTSEPTPLNTPLPLAPQLNPQHPLLQLAQAIDWRSFDSDFSKLSQTEPGRPPLPTRLLVGLHYLKSLYDESDESVVAKWVENPYWQFFCGEQYFQHDLPCHPTTLVKWRQRIGADGMEKLLKQVLQTARHQQALKTSDIKRVIVDTTVQEKAIAFPTDARLYDKARRALVRVNVGSDYQERYTFDTNYRVASTVFTIGARTYTTGYQYNEAGQPLQVGHMNYQYDSAGRLAATGGISNITYNTAGQMTGDRLTVTGLNGGASVTSTTDETFGYDAARMQMTSQTATTTNTNTGSCIPFGCPPPPAGGTNLSLTYNYTATTTGLFGVGTTTGNAGQLLSVSGSIGGVSESASYTYDNYGRLVTSNQASNGSSAQRRFAYDRWGNRTGVWDATSGGTQIQSIALQQSGGVPTNRLTSVTNNSTTLNYSYDASGNVTNDGAHSYAYDSENRLVSVDGGAAGYAYDQQNRRYKKTVDGAVTHYVWEGDKVLGEYNGGTGALQVAYWYVGGRLYKKTGTTTQVFLSDRLSARLTLSNIGAVVGRQGHLPYGEDFAESGTQQKQHFTSYERDAENGTDYAINRQYDQKVGRFNRPDPFSDSADLDKPQTLNRYTYTENEPVNSVDPTGLLTGTICFTYQDPVLRDPETEEPVLRFTCVTFESSPQQRGPRRPIRWSAKRCKKEVKNFARELEQALLQAIGIVSHVVEPFRSSFNALLNANIGAVSSGTAVDLGALLGQFNHLGRLTKRYLKQNGLIIDEQLGEHVDEAFMHFTTAAMMADNIATHCLETMNAKDRQLFEAQLSLLNVSYMYMAFLGGLQPDHFVPGD